MTAWNADEIETFNRRRVSFMRRGIAADLAESLAERLLGRDRDLDDRRFCLECANLSSRTCRVMAIEPLRDLLQRCSTFKPLLEGAS